MNFVMRVIFQGGSCDLFQPSEVGEGLIIGRAAHFKRGTQVVADSGPIGLAEDPAAVIVGELYTTHPRRFTIRHAGDGG